MLRKTWIHRSLICRSNDGRRNDVDNRVCLRQTRKSLSCTLPGVLRFLSMRTLTISQPHVAHKHLGCHDVTPLPREALEESGGR